ncbi:MAG: ROK family protein [Flavobacteriales bacterium]|nr:ROK family protein [Flavobacteriales bacterium]
MNLAAGIDIGGTNILLGIVNESGKILNRTSWETSSFSSPEIWVDAVCKYLQEWLNHHPDANFIGIGIGAPNGNIHSGAIEDAPNLPWKGKIPLVEMFEKQMQYKTQLTNDANAAALGEMLFGAAQNCPHFLFITLGTGLGSGIVVDGKIVYGHDGLAGEIGHVILFPDGRPCACGRKGCVETYCSATAIKTTYAEILKKNNLPEIPKADAKYIFGRAMHGEKEAQEAFNQTGEWLGLILANSVAYTSPEKIILFGGLTQAGDLLLNPTIRSFEKNVLRNYQNKITISYSSLPENDAAILGAASLIINA